MRKIKLFTQKSLIFIYFNQGRPGPSGAGAIRTPTGAIQGRWVRSGADGPSFTFHLPVLYLRQFKLINLVGIKEIVK